MTNEELDNSLRSLSTHVPIKDKRIINFMKRQGKYYEPIKFGSKYYIMTFEYNVYPTRLYDIISFTDRVIDSINSDKLNNMSETNHG